MAQRPVTLADIVAGHVSLEIEGFDRLYLNGWVPALQTSGQIAGWLHWRGFPIASPAALGQNAQAFRAAVRRYADGNQIPWVGSARVTGSWRWCGSAYARGLDGLWGMYQWLDRAPRGRNEARHDDDPLNWFRRHDEYDSQ